MSRDELLKRGRQAHDFMHKQAAELARRDPVVFCQYVLRDEKTNARIELAPMHSSWHDLYTKNKQLIIWAHREAGKALAIDTPIPTPNGWTTMGALQPGDEVFDRHGKRTRVKWCSDVMHGRELFEVEFDDGSVVRADAEHQWIAKNIDDRHAKRQWRTVTTLEMHQRLRRQGVAMWRVPLQGAVEYATAELPIHPYVLGCWLGDGDRDGAQFTCHKDDREMIDRCIALEGGRVGMVREQFPGSNALRFFGVGNGKAGALTLSKRLTRLGLIGKARARVARFIPDVFMTSSIEQREELLAGLLDTDGSIDVRGRKSRVEFSSKFEGLARGVLELARSLGFKARLACGASSLDGRRCADRWRVSFTANRQVFRLKRKADLVKVGPSAPKATAKTVVNISPVASVPVRCIAVEASDSSYLCDRSFTVTHNSQQLTVGRTLYELGKDPNLRIVICSARQTKAEEFLKAIRKYIEVSDDLRRVFPHLAPGDKWTQSEITVMRPGYAKDPSVKAMALHGAGVGSRIDILILDDILDWENCRTPAAREQTIDWIRSTLFGALAPNAKILVVGNAYHPQDALHTWAKEGWPAYRYPVMHPHTGEIRWPKRWTKERIEEVRIRLGPLEFARQMMCIARDDSTSRFQWGWLQACLELGFGKSFDPAGGLVGVPDGYKVCTGVDLNVQKKDTSDLAVIFSIIVHPRTAVREVLAIESGQWGGPETWNRLVDHHRRWMSHVILVENNAAQDFFLQFTANKAALPVMPFTTGRNKAHPEHGVESVAIEMANRKWCIPSIDDGGAGYRGAHPEIEKFVEGCLFYSPDAHTADHLMAGWLAREAINRTVPRFESGYINTMAR